MHKLIGFALVSAALLFAPAITRAQATPTQAPGRVLVPANSEPLVPANSEPVAGPAEPESAPDGVRFRGAIAASGGAEFADGFDVGMAGVEGRVGVQINNLIGVYAQPSLAFGSGRVHGSNLPAFTATLGISALIDFTITNYFFVGIGGGVAILNNPIAPEIHFRIGGYPVVGVGEDGYSRQGLMIGLDARVFFVSVGSQSLNVGQILATIGYEVF